MNEVFIKESGMRFGPLVKDDLFHLEKSDTYNNLSSQIKIAEFIYLKGETIFIFEAKSSSPQILEEFVFEIRDKFLNSLMLFLSLRLNRFDKNADLSRKYLQLSLQKFKVKFVLVINGHKKDWLPPIKDELSKKLKPLIQLLNLDPNPVIVLNDEMARTKNYIS